MKAAVLKAPGLLGAGRNLLDPLCPEDGALLGISVCAVCGTDIKMCEQGHRDLVFPRVLGHEDWGRMWRWTTWLRGTWFRSGLA